MLIIFSNSELKNYYFQLLPVLLVFLLAAEIFVVSARFSKTKKPKDETTTLATETEDIENDPAPKKCSGCNKKCKCGYYDCKKCSCKKCSD
uniref:Candidate secreted effector n=1 Tax=Meloidogyne incognita TaxID=6306 RepID=A0A914LD36_MELIC